MRPVSFMRLKKIKDPKEALKKHDPDELVVQEKIDGFKAFATKEGGKVKIYTRRGKEFQDNVPIVVDVLDRLMPDGTSILGELTYIKDGQQSISSVQTVVGSNPERAIQKTEEMGGKLVYYVYDLLEYRGKKTMGETLVRRDILLRQLVGRNSVVRVVENYTFDQLQRALTNALRSGGEGVVIKPERSTYVSAPAGEDEPSGEWIKYKPTEKAQTDDVILDSYTLGRADPDGYRKAVFPAYQHKNGDMLEVGKLSGLDRPTEARVKRMINAGQTVVAEVTFQERMESGKLRHMGWVRLRPDKPVKSVTVESEQMLESWDILRRTIRENLRIMGHAFRAQ